MLSLFTYLHTNLHTSEFLLVDYKPERIAFIHLPTARWEMGKT